MFKRMLVLVVFVVLFFSMGCQHNDFRMSTVFEGQSAPHDGFNIGPDTYVLQNQPVKVSGVVIWIKGLDPNSVIGDVE